MKANTTMGDTHHRYVWYDGSSKQSGGGHLGSDVLRIKNPVCMTSASRLRQRVFPPYFSCIVHSMSRPV